jgi:hypothetical protein
MDKLGDRILLERIEEEEGQSIGRIEGRTGLHIGEVFAYDAGYSFEKNIDFWTEIKIEIPKEI